MHEILLGIIGVHFTDDNNSRYRVSPLCMNKFCCESMFVSAICSKSNKVILGTQSNELAI